MPNIDDDPVLARLTSYSVGFLKEIQTAPGKRALVPCGSGVLVEIGAIKGVLTAAHVILELQTAKGAGLFTIIRSREKARPLEFDMADAQAVIIGGKDTGRNGPDLGFVRLPLPIEQRLIDEHTFYNFDLRLKLAIDGTVDTMLDSEALVGVVAEKSELKSITEISRIDTHTMVHAYGIASDFRPGPDGFDLFDFQVQHSEHVTRPGSYGGLSGAAVWKLGSTDDANDRIVMGIAFYESDPDEYGNRTVVCQGPSCIYRELIDALRTNFGRQFIEPTSED